MGIPLGPRLSKTKYLDKGNFDGTKSTGGKDSYVPVANDELIGLMAEYNP